MDVERVQKINALALELMKQGLVDDREAAVAKAEGILKKGDSSSLAEQVKDIAPVKEEVKPTEALSQDQIKEIMQKNTSFMVKKMKEFQEQMSQVQTELNNLKVEMRTKPIARPAVKQEVNQKLPVAEKKGNPDHPRSGNYNDTDVSIEKFFYSGNKPQN